MPRCKTFTAAVLAGALLTAAAIAQGTFAQGTARWTTGTPMPSSRTEIAVAQPFDRFGAGAPERIPPLFKADTANLTISASKDGKLRVVYAGWDDANAGAHGVEARKR